MKKYLQWAIAVMILFMITACGSTNDDNHTTNSDNTLDEKQATTNHNNDVNNDNEEHSTANVDDEEDSKRSQKETIQQIADQEITPFSFDLPDELPMDEGKYLTGKTEAKESKVVLTFYQTDTAIPPNDQQLKDQEEGKIASIQIKNEDSKKAAKEAIAFENYTEIGGEPIDLGHDLTGYQDGAAGSLFTSWNEGRWALTTRTGTDHPEQGVELAKEAVDYLEVNTLPPPKKYGSIKLDVDNNDTVIKWQKGTTVYIIDQVDQPMDALKIATSF